MRILIFNSIKLSTYILTLLTVNSLLFAESQEKNFPINIICKDRLTVVDQNVKLAEIADLQFSEKVKDEVKEYLKNIVVIQNINPGEIKQIPGLTIVALIKGAGYLSEQIGYQIPETISINRLGQKIDKQLIWQKLGEALNEKMEKLDIIDAGLAEEITIPIGNVSYKINIEQNDNLNNLKYQLIIERGNEKITRNLIAKTQSWHDVPVAARAMFKGEIISDGDFHTIRIKRNELTQEAIAGESQLIGMQLGNNIPLGGLFYKKFLSPPNIISAGDGILIYFKEPGLELTAKGMALEGGAFGSKIKVRNISSHKVIEGVVTNKNIIEVK